MIVELRGVNFVNKGAELMLHAVVQQLSAQGGIVASPLRVGTLSQRNQADLYHLAWINSKKAPYIAPLIDKMATMMPQRIRNVLHIVTSSQVQTILDASGFAYSDQWGPTPAEKMAQEMVEWKKQGKKVILLPQAFGPFDDAKVRKFVSKIVDKADLVYAREQTSYKYLVDLVGPVPHIKISSDFTNLVEGKVPKYFDTTIKHACIIPNARMIDKTQGNLRERYFQFLVNCIQYLNKREIVPFILMHDTRSDPEIARELQSKAKLKVKVIAESDPLHIKGIIGDCFVVVCSRYHGLVSALSQGVPVIATGWSHKYRLLLDDYNCPECLVDVNNFSDGVDDLFAQVIDEPARSELVDRLYESSLHQKKEVQLMWSEVLDVMRS